MEAIYLTDDQRELIFDALFEYKILCKRNPDQYTDIDVNDIEDLLDVFDDED